MVNINAMVVNGSNHKEQTKTDLISKTTVVSNSDANIVYLSMKKENSFIMGVDFGKRDSRPLSDKFDRINALWNKDNLNFKPIDIHINKEMCSNFQNLYFGNFNHEKNVLDKIIDQLPNNLKTEEQTEALEFVLNQTEFNKIKNLLDKDNYYKGYNVKIIHNYPPKQIALKHTEKSKYF